ncbi:Ser/Thr protein kinase [Legionella lansingensis]|uniref:Ser/Thr protein kinase n=1 Tax=Legionella lansingensis TaxID=45067 RepID=A0A0W0VJI7_9GAMM|nr:protein kinase [Legionella lansingensis]KTD20248.1 Ser/Thr protein kinase [Legionella lansingensis]SNV55333.1 Ser/Thr protein kinase [Legionella lansingensis]
MGNNPLHSFRKGFELAKRADHLALKEPTVEDKSLFSQTSYTVMDEITGPELFDIIADDEDGTYILSTEQRIDLTLALLLALEEQVTKKGLIHRDIKPENIKVVHLGPPAVVKILDYDLSTENPDGEVVGTPRYYAPEIISDPMRTSVKSDVYSMGRIIALIWRVDYTTYADPYTPWDYTPEQILSGIFTDINDLIDEEKTIIQNTLLGMLENDPDDRFSIEDAIDTFSPIFGDQGVEVADEADNRDPVKEEAYDLFLTALAAMSIKTNDLMEKAEKNKRYKPAEEAAKKLFLDLISTGNAFFADREGAQTITPEEFKERCEEAIKNARPELAQHADFSDVFADIAFVTVSVCTVGVANVVSKITTGSFRFFQPKKTDSEEQLDVLAENLKSIKLK